MVNILLGFSESFSPLVFWSFGLWSFGILVACFFGRLVFLAFDLLFCWSFGLMAFGLYVGSCGCVVCVYFLIGLQILWCGIW